jgi:DNA polymerase III epsilon subunit-like protein
LAPAALCGLKSKGDILNTLVLDVETTGLPEKGHEYGSHFLQFPRIVTLAYKFNDEETKDFIINQEGKKIPQGAIDIHGITDAMADASPHFIVPVLSELIATYQPDKVIGHNVYFDISIIKAEILRLIHFKKLERSVFTMLEEQMHKEKRIDIMKKSTKYCAIPGPRGAKWPKLTELYLKLFGVELSGAHSSRADCDAAHKCYVELVRLGIIK